MKIANFNIENIFHRDEKLIKKPNKESVTDWMHELEHLIRKRFRTHRDFTRMRELSFLLELQNSPLEPYLVMRRRAGNLYLHFPGTTKQYKAIELSNWNGWIKLSSLPITEIAINNKARVICQANPDILLLQEVEDRQSLVEFNQHFLPPGVAFDDIILLPGNDPRGLDMAIMTKNGYKIKSITSHVNDFYHGGKVFDKDFHEFEILTPNGQTLWILSTHLIDQGLDKARRDSQRTVQAQLMAEIYEITKAERGKYVIVTGSLNAPSYCNSLEPLFKHTDLKDISLHKSFNVDLDNGKDANYHSLGAYRMGVNTKQRDYLLLSPQLFKWIKNSGLNRKGVWPRKKNQYRVYRSLQSELQQASSHALIWVDI